MTTLVILSGINHPDSKTRLAALQHVTDGLNHGTEAVVVDVATNPIDPAFPDPSSPFVQQLLQADSLVLAAPVYNFGIPSALKAWIDQVVVAGTTFDPTTYTGLLRDIPVYIYTASGGVDPFVTQGFGPYLHQVLRFIGLTNITITDVS